MREALRAALIIGVIVLVPLAVMSAPTSPSSQPPVAQVTGSLSVTHGGSLTITNTPPSAPAPTPSPFLHYIIPTLFVIAMTTDPTTSARIEVSVARHLQRAVKNQGQFQVATAPNWTLSDFLNQCSVDSLGPTTGTGATAGALLIFNGSLQQGTESYFLDSRGFSRIDADAMLLECNQQQANVLWVAHDVHGFNNRNSFTPLPADALILGILAAVAQHSQQTVATYTYPTPTAAVPYTSSIATTVGSNSGNTTAASVEISGLAALAGTSPQEYAYPGLNTDVINRRAVERLAFNLIVDYMKGHAHDPKRAEEFPGFMCPTGHLCTDWFDFTKVDETDPKKWEGEQ